MTSGPDITLTDVRIPRVFVKAPDFGGRPDGACLRGTLVLRQGRAAALLPADWTAKPRVVLPRLIEAHCHLDKCHTLHRLNAVGGDLMAAIVAQRDDKAHWTAEDLSHRARRGLAECAASGCGAVRSHIDWGDSTAPPLAWEVLPHLDPAGMVVQWAALTGIDQMADAEFATAVARHVAATPGGVLGSFIRGQDPDMVRNGLRHIFDAALRHDLPLDFHVDEGPGPLDGVEQILDAALAARFDGPLVLGHAVALIDKDPADFARIADKIDRAGAAVCALPTTNLYLQGRGPGTPDRRGITRLRELQAAGVPVIVGSDNVADAFCPLGRHDPMGALHLACLTAHLDPPLARHLPMITTDAATALGLPSLSVDGAPITRLLISDAPDTAGLIAGHSTLDPLTAHVPSSVD